MPANNANLRSACDRCHGQKLRCTKSASAIDCDRCLKAKTSCVHSAALRFGRKAASQMTQSCSCADHGVGSSENSVPTHSNTAAFYRQECNADTLMKAIVSEEKEDDDSAAETLLNTEGVPRLPRRRKCLPRPGMTIKFRRATQFSLVADPCS